MAILTVGIDLAKNVFAVHGINEAGRAELVRPSVARDKLHELIAALPPCAICGSPAPATAIGLGLACGGITCSLQFEPDRRDVLQWHAFQDG